MRIAFGGIHTECSTYSRIRSREQDFRVERGSALIQNRSFQFLSKYGHEFVPLLHARAVPGGPVERGTYENLKAEFLERLRAALPVDGVYLAMHGAMFVEGMQDAEGDWIAAVRELAGDECLLSASYDLHGNLSRKIIDQLDILSAYRTAPHIDEEETGVRACDILVACLESGTRPKLVWTAIPVLMPGERSSTVDEPAKRLYAELPEMDRREEVMDASLLVGYVWADEPRATASAVITGTGSAEELGELANELGWKYWNAREEFNFGAVRTGTIEQCLDWALEAETRPVILADSGDNPTGGGVGDRAEVLERLIARGIGDVLIAGIADHPAVEACFAAGLGATLQLKIGATLDPEGSRPVEVEARVTRLDEELRQAVVEAHGITVVLTSRRRPFHYIEDFARLGYRIEDFKILVVKSGYLSPELAPIANPNLMALSDGAINQDIEGLPRNRFRPATFPFDKSFRWKPEAYVSARAK